jgi:hypothetical protein
MRGTLQSACHGSTAAATWHVRRPACPRKLRYVPWPDVSRKPDHDGDLPLPMDIGRSRDAAELRPRRCPLPFRIVPSEFHRLHEYATEVARPRRVSLDREIAKNLATVERDMKQRIAIRSSHRRTARLRLVRSPCRPASVHSISWHACCNRT